VCVRVCLIENRHKTSSHSPIDRAEPSAVCPIPPSDIVCSTSPCSLQPVLVSPPSVFFSPPIPSPAQLYFHPRKTGKKRKIEKITEGVLNHNLGCCSNFYSLRREEKEGYRSTSSSQTLTFQGVYIIISLLFESLHRLCWQLLLRMHDCR